MSLTPVFIALFLQIPYASNKNCELLSTLLIHNLTDEMFNKNVQIFDSPKKNLDLIKVYDKKCKRKNK